MNLLEILLILIAIGILIYLVNTYIPMDGRMKKIFNIVAIGGVVIWLLKSFGVISYLSNINI